MAALTANKNPAKAALNNSGTRALSRMVRVESIKTGPVFSKLFKINPHVLAQITDDMKKHGFDMSKPLDVWRETGELLDGHTRRAAAEAAGLFEVPVYEHSFENVDAAVEYALGVQLARRNLSDAELAMAVTRLDELKQRGRKKSEGAVVERGRSSERLAEKLGTNARKVEKVRAIERDADEETKAALKDGKMSINAAYKKTKAPVETRPRAATFEPLGDRFICMKAGAMPAEVRCSVCANKGLGSVCVDCKWKMSGGKAEQSIE